MAQSVAGRLVGLVALRETLRGVDCTVVAGIGVLLLPLYFAVVALILYFVVKLAVKSAVREPREEKTL